MNDGSASVGRWLSDNADVGFSAEDILKAQAEDRVNEIVTQAEFARIQQVPGIGPVLGMLIALKSGDFARFASAGDFASYSRTVKSEHRSNGK